MTVKLHAELIKEHYEMLFLLSYFFFFPCLVTILEQKREKNNPLNTPGKRKKTDVA